MIIVLSVICALLLGISATETAALIFILKKMKREETRQEKAAEKQNEKNEKEAEFYEQMNRIMTYDGKAGERK